MLLEQEILTVDRTRRATAYAELRAIILRTLAREPDDLERAADLRQILGYDAKWQIDAENQVRRVAELRGRRSTPEEREQLKAEIRANEPVAVETLREIWNKLAIGADSRTLLGAITMFAPSCNWLGGAQMNNLYQQALAVECPIDAAEALGRQAKALAIETMEAENALRRILPAELPAAPSDERQVIHGHARV